MNIAICDDDKQCSGILNMLLNEYASKNELKNFTVYIYTSGEDLLDDIQNDEHFDMCILDIMMPGLSGIDLGIKLRDNGYDGIIIYLTSSKDYALDSYKVKALNYILKPIVPVDLFSTLDDALKSIAAKTDRSVIIKTKAGNIKVSINDILYIELCKRILVYHLADGSTLESIYIRVPFSEAVQEFTIDKNFVQCGNGIVVNISLVSQVGSEEIVFNNTRKEIFSKKIINVVRLAWTNNQ